MDVLRKEIVKEFFEQYFGNGDYQPIRVVTPNGDRICTGLTMQDGSLVIIAKLKVKMYMIPEPEFLINDRPVDTSLTGKDQTMPFIYYSVYCYYPNRKFVKKIVSMTKIWITFCLTSTVQMHQLFDKFIFRSAVVRRTLNVIEKFSPILIDRDFNFSKKYLKFELDPELLGKKNFYLKIIINKKDVYTPNGNYVNVFLEDFDVNSRFSTSLIKTIDVSQCKTNLVVDYPRTQRTLNALQTMVPKEDRRECLKAFLVKELINLLEKEKLINFWISFSLPDKQMRRIIRNLFFMTNEKFYTNPKTDFYRKETTEDLAKRSTCRAVKIIKQMREIQRILTELSLPILKVSMMEIESSAIETIDLFKTNDSSSTAQKSLAYTSPQFISLPNVWDVSKGVIESTQNAASDEEITFSFVIVFGITDLMSQDVNSFINDNFLEVLTELGEPMFSRQCFTRVDESIIRECYYPRDFLKSFIRIMNRHENLLGFKRYNQLTCRDWRLYNTGLEFEQYTNYVQDLGYSVANEELKKEFVYRPALVWMVSRIDSIFSSGPSLSALDAVKKTRRTIEVYRLIYLPMYCIQTRSLDFLPVELQSAIAKQMDFFR
jgi:hypothetical protein